MSTHFRKQWIRYSAFGRGLPHSFKPNRTQLFGKRTLIAERQVTNSNRNSKWLFSCLPGCKRQWSVMCGVSYRLRSIQALRPIQIGWNQVEIIMVARLIQNGSRRRRSPTTIDILKSTLFTTLNHGGEESRYGYCSNKHSLFVHSWSKWRCLIIKSRIASSQIGPTKVRSDEVISFGSNESTVEQVSVHGVSNGGDIGHDKEATGSHPGPSLYVWIFRANRKM